MEVMFNSTTLKKMIKTNFNRTGNRKKVSAESSQTGNTAYAIGEMKEIKSCGD
jgi:hypothetical protein